MRVVVESSRAQAQVGEGGGMAVVELAEAEVQDRIQRWSSEVFIAGTQPVQTCRLHGDGHTAQVAAWDPVQPQPSSEDVRTVANARVTDPGGARVIQVTPQQPAAPKPAKKGWFQRIGDLFK